MKNSSKQPKSHSLNSSNTTEQQTFLVQFTSKLKAGDLQKNPMAAMAAFDDDEDKSVAEETPKVEETAELSSSKEIEPVSEPKGESVAEETPKVEESAELSSSKEIEPVSELKGESVAEETPKVEESAELSSSKEIEPVSELKGESVAEETPKVEETAELSSSKEIEPVSEPKGESVAEETPVKNREDKKNQNAKEANSNSNESISYQNIIRKAQTEENEFTTIRLRKETISMLDAILLVSEKKVSKATVIHNLVSAFLNENKGKLKELSAKKIRKEYF